MNLKIIADALLGTADIYPDFEPISIKISDNKVYFFSETISITVDIYFQTITMMEIDND